MVVLEFAADSCLGAVLLIVDVATLILPLERSRITLDLFIIRDALEADETREVVFFFTVNEVLSSP